MSIIRHSSRYNIGKPQPEERLREKKEKKSPV